MNHRERMIKAFTFDHPDRIPVYHHPSPAGLYVHGEKLLKLFQKYPADNNITFVDIPKPDPKTLNAQGDYRDTTTDAWGTTWEYSIFGIQGHPKAFPLSDYRNLDSYVFPQPPAIDSDYFRSDKKAIAAAKSEYLSFGGFASILERVCALRPMDEVLMEIYTRDENYLRLLDRVVEYQIESLRFSCETGCEVLFLGDDWGFQTGPVISTEVFREIFTPRYRKLIDVIKQSGRRVFFHSCGSLGAIFDELIDLGIDGIWHQVNRYDMREFALKCKKHHVTAFIHPDRQHLIPRGTPAEIRASIKEYAALYHEMGGGGIFYIEIENDAPFENVVALFEAVQEFA